MLLALGCKENIAATVALAGLFIAYHRRVRLGMGITALALIWGVIAIKVIVPAFNSLGDGFYQIWDPAALGIALGAGLPNGGEVLDSLGNRAALFFAMIRPTAGICLLSPVAFAISLPQLILEMVHTGVPYITSHRLIGALEGVVLGAIGGLAVLRRFLARHTSDAVAHSVVSRSLALGLCLMTVISSFGAHRGIDSYVGDLMRQPWAKGAQIRPLLSRVPDDVPVLTNDGGLSSHLPRREYLLFHFTPGSMDETVMRGWEDVEYIVLRVQRRENQVAPEELADHFPLRPVGHAADVWVWEVLGPDGPSTDP
jgi:hypothetical protein